MSAFAKTDPRQADLLEALDILLFSVLGYEARAPYWYLCAVQRHAGTLIPLLSSDSRANLLERFETRYPKGQRLSPWCPQRKNENIRSTVHRSAMTSGLCCAQYSGILRFSQKIHGTLFYSMYPPRMGETACWEKIFRTPLEYLGCLGCQRLRRSARMASISSGVLG